MKDSARLRGLDASSHKRRSSVASATILKLATANVDNQQLVWLIVGLGLFPAKQYRQIFRLLAAHWVPVPSSATITMARKRLSASVLEKARRVGRQAFSKLSRRAFICLRQGPADDGH
ncbi:transposase domain-containing protein [Novipirellula caenicola]|uniref:transposase domain-containing protein n=1 Tax=Novipirellula caenicola TaxID=1536901 RepID=UPI003CD07644